MGLDMFLSKVKREQVAYWRKANCIHDWFNNHCANGQLENCKDYPVTKEQLTELKETCEKVLKASKLVTGQVINGEKYNPETQKFEPCYGIGKKIEDPSLAQELLPTAKGFFFGSTQYDEWYVEDLQETVEQIDEILATVDFDEYDVVYHAWW